MVTDVILIVMLTVSVVASCLGIGYRWGSSQERSKHRIAELEAKPPETPREMCLCNHVVSMHDSTGCHATVLVTEKEIIGEEDFFYDETYSSQTQKGRKAITRNKVIDRHECPCVRYVGPHSTYAPELEG